MGTLFKDGCTGDSISEDLHCRSVYALQVKSAAAEPKSPFQKLFNKDKMFKKSQQKDACLPAARKWSTEL